VNLNLLEPKLRVAIFYLILGIFLSRVAWFDIRIAVPDFGLIYALFFVYAALLAPLLGLVLLAGYRFLVEDTLVASYVAINVYGALLGFAYANDFSFLASDSFKFLLLPGGYVAFRLAQKELQPERVLKIAVIFVVVFELLKFGAFAATQGGFLGMVYGGILDFLPLAYVGSRMLLKPGMLNIIIWTAYFVVVLLGQKRTLLVVSMTSMLFFAWSARRRRRTWGFFAMALVALTLIGGYTATTEVAKLSGEAIKRISGTDIASDIGSRSKRLREVRLVVEELHKGGVVAWVFGYGHGATFVEEVPDRRTGARVTHSVHFTPAAMLFRYGILGLALFVGTAVTVLKRSRIEPMQSGATLSRSSQMAIRGYLIAAVLASLVIYGLVDDLLVGVLYGIATAERQRLPFMSLVAVK